MENQIVSFLSILISVAALVGGIVFLVRAQGNPSLQRTILLTAGLIILLSYVIACVITFLVMMILAVIGSALLVVFLILFFVSIMVSIIVLPIAAILHWLKH